MTQLPPSLHGAYLRAQLIRQLGSYAVRAAVKHGQLIVFAREVLVDTRVAASLMTRAAAAQLYAGLDSVLTAFTALALHGCSAAPAGAPEVLVPYHRRLRSRPDLVVHHGRFVEQDVGEIAGLRVVSREYALAEVLCRRSRADALACADQVLAMVPQHERVELRATVEAQIMARPDPRGRRRGLVLLDLASGLAESPAESWFLLRLFDAGLPLPQRQHPVCDISGREIYWLDFAWPELRIAVEYDGYAAHRGRELRDAARAEDLRRRGWHVIRATSADLRDPSRVVAEVHVAFAARGATAA